jgi:hypothetical protein
MLKVRNLLAMAVAVGFAMAAGGASAQNVFKPSGAASTPALTSGALALTATLIHQSNPTIATTLRGGTFTTIDTPARFTCQTTCVIEVEALLQVGNNTVPNNRWAGGAVINGVVQTFQPILGTLPTNASFEARVYSFAVQLAPGAHTIATAVGVTTTARLGSFHIDYRLFTLG